MQTNRDLSFLHITRFFLPIIEQTRPVYSMTFVTPTLHTNAYTVKTSYQFDFERFLSATYC